MAKIDWKPGTMIYPLPAVMVSLGDTPEFYNIITIAWTGTICSDPPLCYISVRPGRYSHEILQRTGEFVINLTTRKLAYAADWCGVRSGRDYNKFTEMKLTPGKALKVNAPIIMEAPLNIECRVIKILPLGSHDMFMAEVVNVKADDRFISTATGALMLEEAGMIAFMHGRYYTMGEKIGGFGFSVKKKPRKPHMTGQRKKKR